MPQFIQPVLVVLDAKELCTLLVDHYFFQPYDILQDLLYISGHAVAQLVEEGRGLDSRRFHWGFH